MLKSKPHNFKWKIVLVLWTYLDCGTDNKSTGRSIITQAE
jgi:hypothetical protein